MRWLGHVAAGASVVLAAGCTTTGTSSEQVANSVYATHRIVKGLETDLQARVEKLNQTTADLTAKVEASDVATRQLQSLMEENQAKLNTLQQSIDRLSRVVFEQSGRSVGGIQAEQSTVVPPGGSVSPSAPPGMNPPAAPQSTIPGTATPPSQPTGAASNALEDYNRAQESFLNDNFELALQQYNAYLQRYPTAENAANAQYWKAECYRKLGQWEQAVREFETVRTTYPLSRKVPQAMLNQAECHLRLGQSQRAIELLTQLSTNEKFATDAASEQARTRLRELQGQ